MVRHLWRRGQRTHRTRGPLLSFQMKHGRRLPRWAHVVRRAHIDCDRLWLLVLTKWRLASGWRLTKGRFRVKCMFRRPRRRMVPHRHHRRARLLRGLLVMLLLIVLLLIVLRRLLIVLLRLIVLRRDLQFARLRLGGWHHPCATRGLEKGRIDSAIRRHLFPKTVLRAILLPSKARRGVLFG